MYWEPIRASTVDLTYSYNYTQIESGCHASRGVPAGALPHRRARPHSAIQPGAKPVGPRDGDRIGRAVATQSVEGNPMPQAPANKVAVNVNYTWQFDPGNFTLSAQLRLEGRLLRWHLHADLLLGAVLGRSRSARGVERRPRASTRVIGFVKNVFDSLGYDAAGGATGTTVPRTASITAYELTPPRTLASRKCTTSSSRARDGTS